jgi:uncharacterized protein YutD
VNFFLTKLINKFRSEILDTAKPEKVNQYFSNIYQSYYAIGAMWSYIRLQRLKAFFFKQQRKN